MYGCSSGDTRLYWSESTPIAHTVAGLAGFGSGLEHAETRTTSGGVDDVGAGLVLRRSDLLALGRVVEAGEVRRLRDVVRQHLDVGVDGLRTGGVAGLELLDEVVLDATDEADRAGLALERSGGADEERALLLGEDERCHVRRIDDGVDDGEARVRVVRRDFREGVLEQEAVALDEPGPTVDETLEAFGAVAVAGGRRLAEGDAEIGLGLARAQRRRRR